MEVTQAPTVAVEKPNLLPPAGDPKPPNGQGAALATAAMPVPDQELLKQFQDIQRRATQINSLARHVSNKKREIGKQETKFAEAESSLKGERNSLHQLERERDELQDELTTLALGKNSERLPFKDPEAAPCEQKPPASNDAWKSVLLGELGIKSKRVLQALHDHNPPIMNHGELSAWQEKKGDFWAKDIKGLGDKGRDEIEKAQFSYFNAHPECCKADTKADSFDDGEIDLTTVKTLIFNPEVLRIEVAQHVGGRWAKSCFAQVGDSRLADDFFNGSFPSQAEAIVAACDAVDQFVKSHLNNKKLPAKARKQAKEIRRSLDGIDKSTAAASPEAAKTVAKGLPDPAAQADADVKAISNDRTAIKARENLPHPTPRDAKGKPKKFRGNKRK